VKPRVRSGQTPSKRPDEGEGGGGTTVRGKKAKEQLEAIAEFVDEEAMAHYDTQLIVYHEELKIYVKFCADYEDNKVKMYADLHDFLSPEAAEKLEQTEGFEAEIEQPRDGEKLWDCIRDILIVGASEQSAEINRRRAEQYFETFKQDSKSPNLTTHKANFREAYRRHVAAGNKEFTEEELAKRYMWSVDTTRYREAVSYLLNETKKPGVKFPETVEAMNTAIKDHINLGPIAKKESASANDALSDALGFAFAANVEQSDDDDEVQNKGKGKRPKEKESKFPFPLFCTSSSYFTWLGVGLG
jgi:hypothetical protein